MGRTGGLNCCGSFIALLERSVGNRSDQRLFHWRVLPNATASFSGRCGGRSAVISGCATGNNSPACAHEWRKNHPAISIRLTAGGRLCVCCAEMEPNGHGRLTHRLREVAPKADDRPDRPTTSKVAICRSLRPPSTFYSVRPAKGRYESSQFSTEVSHSKFCVLHTKVSLNDLFQH